MTKLVVTVQTKRGNEAEELIIDDHIRVVDFVGLFAERNGLAPSRVKIIKVRTASLQERTIIPHLLDS